MTKSKTDLCQRMQQLHALKDAVRKVAKTWHDVISVSSNLAEDVRKMVNDISASEVVRSVHVMTCRARFLGTKKP